jgi:ABC-type transport system substrate-binding protein
MHVVRRSFLALFFCTIFFCQNVCAKEYDGIWFAGFNLNKTIFQGASGKLIRQAFNFAVNRKDICTKIIDDETVPSSIIPPSMPGFDESIRGNRYDIKEAKKLMKKAGLTMNDSRIKELFMVHTSGIKTIAIAQAIKLYLADIGVKINLVEMESEEQEKWQKELESGKYHLFLMGYKAEKPDDPFSLLEPLFKDGGDYNFTFFKNRSIEQLFNLKTEVSMDEKIRRAKEINKIIADEAVIINLFYIEKI